MNIKTWMPNVNLFTITKDGALIQYVEDPSVEIQMIAVKNHVRNIQWIIDPDITVQEYAIKTDFESIKYIKNPLEEIQILAMKENPWVICHIEEPTEKVILSFLQQDIFMNNTAYAIDMLIYKQDTAIINNTKYFLSPKVIQYLYHYGDHEQKERIKLLDNYHGPASLILEIINS